MLGTSWAGEPNLRILFNFLSVFWISFLFPFVFLPSRMTGNQLGHDILFLVLFSLLLANLFCRFNFFTYLVSFFLHGGVLLYQE
ncbi:hypothetical protein V8C43DRAFT_63091 [Trichoderma afarasin]